MINSNGNNYVYYNQSAFQTINYSSIIFTRTGHFKVSSQQSYYSANNQFLTPVWQNITENEVSVIHQTATYQERNMHGVSRTTTTWSYPLAMDLGAKLTYLYSRQQGPSSGFHFTDSYYNYTSYFLNVTQGLQISSSTLSVLNGVNTRTYSYLNDAIENSDGVFSATLEESPYFAILSNVTDSHHVTHKVYTAYTLNIQHNWRLSGSYYTHVMTGVEDDSSSYYLQETVTQNFVNQGSF